MDIQNIKLDKLIPYENNPRQNDNAVDKVATSIQEFGFKVPIVIDKDNVIVAGHTRYKAAQRIGLETVPCIIADDLTDDQVKAFRIADNKVAEYATWDYNALNLELEEITIDMQPFGFMIDDLNLEKSIERDEIELSNVFEIIINCEDETDLENKYEKLINEGYECRISTL